MNPEIVLGSDDRCNAFECKAKAPYPLPEGEPFPCGGLHFICPVLKR